MKTRRVPFDINKAKSGAKVVTRAGYPVRIGFFDAKSNQYPIIAAVDTGGVECPYSFTEQGRSDYNADENEYSELDLFIEEEVEEDVEETDDYDPYKEVVKSIADMAERYSELQSLEELKDFYNNVRVKCREAVEYNWEDEKPADNKPKFKVGDWVIDKHGMVQQITDVRKNIYKPIYEYSTISYSLGILSYGCFNENVKDIRLWNIKDAKDGDVLYSGEVIFIFNRIKGEWIHCYCTLHRDGSFISENYDLMHIKHCKEVQPATKEQRELFFQKMKDAGYEWNSDKKELHKIEEVKKRRMTQQEFSWWLRDCPGEHREYMVKGGHTAYTADYNYPIDEADEEIGEVYIRRNGGEWQEPLIEI